MKKSNRKHHMSLAKKERCIQQNKYAYELLLSKEAKKMCSRLGMNIADWQLDEVLAQAIKTHPKRGNLKALSASYDNLYETGTNLQVPIDPKYKHLHGLMQD